MEPNIIGQIGFLASFEIQSVSRLSDHEGVEPMLFIVMNNRKLLKKRSALTCIRCRRICSLFALSVERVNALANLLEVFYNGLTA